MDKVPQEHEARKYHRRIVIMVYKNGNLAVRKKQKTRGKTEGDESSPHQEIASSHNAASCSKIRSPHMRPIFPLSFALPLDLISLDLHHVALLQHLGQLLGYFFPVNQEIVAIFILQTHRAVFYEFRKIHLSRCG